MDEPEIVNRREAMAGISLLSLMMLLLIGTTMYRITQSRASVKRIPTPAMAADQAATRQPTEAPPRILLDEKLQEASHADAEPDAKQPVPNFVAPGSRHR